MQETRAYAMDMLKIEEEADIIRRVRSGDASSFETLVHRYQGRVLGLARRFLGNVHDAEDACQEAFVRAFNALGGFDTRLPFENWLLRIATNVCRRHASRRRKVVPLGDLPVAAPATAHARETEENVTALRTALAEAMRRLSETKRTALVLLHQAGRSYVQIAEIMDLPLGTVKTAIHRARMEIRAVLAERDLL